MFSMMKNTLFACAAAALCFTGTGESLRVRVASPSSLLEMKKKTYKIFKGDKDIEHYWNAYGTCRQNIKLVEIDSSSSSSSLDDDDMDDDDGTQLGEDWLGVCDKISLFRPEARSWMDDTSRYYLPDNLPVPKKLPRRGVVEFKDVFISEPDCLELSHYTTTYGDIHRDIPNCAWDGAPYNELYEDEFPTERRVLTIGEEFSDCFGSFKNWISKNEGCVCCIVVLVCSFALCLVLWHVGVIPSFGWVLVWTIIIPPLGLKAISEVLKCFKAPDDPHGDGCAGFVLCVAAVPVMIVIGIIIKIREG